MSSGTVGHVLDWQNERTAAVAARSHAAAMRAVTDFERIAAELAGDDQTMRRVLEARLLDSYERGRADKSDDDRYHTFGWLEEWAARA